jgi:hypothetical protein
MAGGNELILDVDAYFAAKHDKKIAAEHALVKNGFSLSARQNSSAMKQIVHVTGAQTVKNRDLFSVPLIFVNVRHVLILAFCGWAIVTIPL